MMGAEQHEDQRPGTAQRMQSKIEKKQGQFQLALDDDLMDALRLPDLLSSELPNDFDLPDLPPRTLVSSSLILNKINHLFSSVFQPHQFQFRI